MFELFLDTVSRSCENIKADQRITLPEMCNQFGQHLSGFQPSASNRDHAADFFLFLKVAVDLLHQRNDFLGTSAEHHAGIGQREPFAPDE